MRQLLIPTVFTLAMGVLLVSCEDTVNEEPKDSELKLNISNLMELGSNEQYEGWIIVDGAPVSTGTFTVDASGKLSNTGFIVKKSDLEAAKAFVLSIEPNPDSDPAPSAIKILGGDFSGATAAITASHGAALGQDFSASTGKYILATPTTATTEDELSGVWYLDLTGGSPAVGLDLPTLPAGWVYEGWTVFNGKPVSSGTFTATNKADAAAPFSGSDASGPMFPGEDYVKNAPAGLSFPTNLSGTTMVISIEPSPDNSPDPFVFKPLVGAVPEKAKDHVTYEMSNKSVGFPVGTVTR